MQDRLRSGYHRWVVPGAALAFGSLACSSGGSSGSQASTASSAPALAVIATSTPVGALPLQAKNAQRVTYTVEGKPTELLDYPTEKVKVSASCERPDGTLACDAMTLLRKTSSVHLTPAELGGGIAPGAVVCRKLQIPSTTGRDAKGNEDGFCSFPDGSLASHGSVDTHVLAP